MVVHSVHYRDDRKDALIEFKHNGSTWYKHLSEEVHKDPEKLKNWLNTLINDVEFI